MISKGSMLFIVPVLLCGVGEKKGNSKVFLQEAGQHTKKEATTCILRAFLLALWYHINGFLSRAHSPY